MNQTLDYKNLTGLMEHEKIKVECISTFQSLLLVVIIDKDFVLYACIHLSCINEAVRNYCLYLVSKQGVVTKCSCTFTCYEHLHVDFGEKNFCISVVTTIFLHFY